MFHNISNPKWFGNWSRLEDDYLGNGGKGSSKKRPVICLETGVQFESAIAALKWLDSGKTNNRGNMRTALISGSALLGYHFYYADEPKPPNSHFK